MYILLFLHVGSPQVDSKCLESRIPVTAVDSLGRLITVEAVVAEWVSHLFFLFSFVIQVPSTHLTSLVFLRGGRCSFHSRADQASLRGNERVPLLQGVENSVLHVVSARVLFVIVTQCSAKVAHRTVINDISSIRKARTPKPFSSFPLFCRTPSEISSFVDNSFSGHLASLYNKVQEQDVSFLPLSPGGIREMAVVKLAHRT